MDHIVPPSLIKGKCDRSTLTDLVGLPDFVVIGYEIDPWEERLILFCEPTHPVAVCPDCLHVSQAVHQYHHRVVRDRSVFGMACYLEFEIRRFWCDHCATPFTERLEAVGFNSSYTRRYEAYIFQRVRASTIEQVRQEESLGYKAVADIFQREVERRMEGDARPPVRVLGIDEISLKKHHGQYVLILSDLERRCIIDVLPNRLKETLEAWLDSLPEEARKAIEVVSMDMHAPFLQAVEAQLGPRVQVVADRFHVMHNLLACVTKARREIQRTADEETQACLKGIRWLIVSNRENLSQADREKLDRALAASPELKTLYELKETFRQIFETNWDREEAARNLQAWVADAQATGLKSLKPFLTTLHNWWEQILNYFHARVTQGFVEGINNKVKLIKRRCFGFRNFHNFRLRLLAQCGLPL